MSTTTQHQDTLTAPASRTDRQHLGYLDGLRAIAALYVVAYHVWSYYNGHLNPSISRLVMPMSFGPYAVAVFIVLSGFCLMLPVSRSQDGCIRGGAKRFFLSRARRILPPYFFAIIFSLLSIWLLIGHATGTPWDYSIPVTQPGFLTHLFLLQDWSPKTYNQIDPPLWSVSVEWRIYFAFPLLVLLWRRLGPWVTTSSAVLLACILMYFLLHIPFLLHHHSLDSRISPQFLGLFALGMLASCIAFSQDARFLMLRSRLPWGWLTAATFAALVVATNRIPLNSYGHPKLDFFVGAFSVCLLVAASQTGRLQSFLSMRALVVIGSFAYSLYLIHYPVIQIVWQYIVHPLHLKGGASLALLWLIGIPVAVGVAFGFHLAFERPFMSNLGTCPPKNEHEAEIAAAVSPAP